MSNASLVPPKSFAQRFFAARRAATLRCWGVALAAG